MIKKELPIYEKEVLISLGETLKLILEEKAKLEKWEKDIKKDIINISSLYYFPQKEEISEYIAIHSIGESLRVTTASIEPTIDWKKLRKLIDDDTLFLELCTIKTATFNQEKWEDLIDSEIVKKNDLLDIIVLPKEPTKVSIGFGNLR